MKKKKIYAAMALAAGVFVSLAACGNSDSPDTASSTSSTAASESGQVLNVQFDVEVASLDSQIATDGTSFEAIAATIEGLYVVDESGQPVEAMVDSATKSEDGLTYEFTLKDAKWSNGTEVTANDFVFAWQRLVDPATASEYSFIMSIAGVKNADAIIAGEITADQLGVTAVDDKTLKVELDTPVSFFESLMTFPSFYPLNEEFFNEIGGTDVYGTSPDTILANGAFKFSAYEPAATTIELEKNPDYYDADKVSLAGIKFQVIKDSQQAVLSFNNGDLDVVTLAGEQVDLYKEDPQFTNVMAGYLWYISPNQKVAGLENENLRKAIALAFDKENIVNNVLKDGSIVADFMVPKDLATGPDGSDFREDAGTYLSTDKVKALEYFEAAKKELGKDSFTYTMVVEDTESAINVAQVLKAQIEETLPGLTINIEQMPKKNRVERMQNGDFELGLTRWGPDYADPMTYLDMWTTDSPNNYGFWSNAEYDAIIASAQKGELATDTEARWEALIEAEAIVGEEAVIFPVYQKGNAVMVKDNVQGIEFHSVGTNRVFKNTTKE